MDGGSQRDRLGTRRRQPDRIARHAVTQRVELIDPRRRARRQRVDPVLGRCAGGVEERRHATVFQEVAAAGYGPVGEEFGRVHVGPVPWVARTVEHVQLARLEQRLTESGCDAQQIGNAVTIRVEARRGRREGEGIVHAFAAQQLTLRRPIAGRGSSQVDAKEDRPLPPQIEVIQLPGQQPAEVRQRDLIGQSRAPSPASRRRRNRRS